MGIFHENRVGRNYTPHLWSYNTPTLVFQMPIQFWKGGYTPPSTLTLKWSPSYEPSFTSPLDIEEDGFRT